MTSPTKTDSLIRELARHAGTQPPTASFGTGLILAIALSLATGVLLVLLAYGIQPTMSATLAGAPFQHKVGSTFTLAVGAAIFVHATARPGASMWWALALLPGVAVLAFGAITDSSGFPLAGRSSVSVPGCLAMIVLLSLPALAMLLAALRRGVPTRPALAGAVAGILAGSIGASAYAIVCKNDGGLFVAIWYSVAVLVVAGLGALLGRRWLAW